MKYIDLIIGKLRALKMKHKIAFVVIFFAVEQICTGDYQNWWTIITIEFKTIMAGKWSEAFFSIVACAFVFALLKMHDRATTKWMTKKFPSLAKFLERLKV